MTTNSDRYMPDALTTRLRCLLTVEYLLSLPQTINFIKDSDTNIWLLGHYR